ncbi:MAG TPA: lipid A deacylase LpxR family protein [Verrucomicrobiae bacterium]
MNRKKNFLFAAISLFLALPVWSADEAGGFFSITDENDAWSNFFGPHQDRHYTHGTKLTLMLREHSLTNTVVPLWGIHDAVASRGFVLGQNMFTPQNILDPKPIPTDRPYAGWLYTGLVYQRRGEFFTHCAVMENFEVNVGVVGPWSFAGETQRFIHRWRFPEDIPAGWDNQLKNEPGLVLKYARLWRWSPTTETAKYFDVIPRAGAEVGNVTDFATAGVTARLGFNLPPDFGMQIIDSPASVNGGLMPSPRFSIYTFAGVDGRAVARDITLDGNSFRNGPGVDKYNFVNDLSWGVAAQIGRHLEVSYAQVTRSKQFHGQVNKDVFGSIEAKFMCSF